MTTVYRLFDGNGTLLYVGMTDRLLHRLGSHQVNKTWWEDVAKIEVERFEDRAAANIAEQRAIDGGLPLYNVNRARGETPVKCFRINADLYKAAQDKAAEKGETVTDVVRRALEAYVSAD